MRLIDGKALLAQFVVNSNGKRIPERDCDNFPIAISISDVKKMIRDMPTIESVKHGKWAGSRFHHRFENSYEEQCTACGAWSLEYDCDYCPNCGADMRMEPRP